MIVEDGQGDGAQPLAAGREHLLRSVVEIEMPERSDVGGFIAADLARLPPSFGAGFARAQGAVAEKSPGFLIRPRARMSRLTVE